MQKTNRTDTSLFSDTNKHYKSIREGGVKNDFDEVGGGGHEQYLHEWVSQSGYG